MTCFVGDENLQIDLEQKTIHCVFLENCEIAKSYSTSGKDMCEGRRGNYENDCSEYLKNLNSLKEI
jgi:hypothetical protein